MGAIWLINEKTKIPIMPHHLYGALYRKGRGEEVKLWPQGRVRTGPSWENQPCPAL